MALVLTDVVGPVGIIKLNRADKLNSITPEMIGDIQKAMDLLEANTKIRVILLMGAGKAFSAGFDLNTGDWSSIETTKQEIEATFDLVMRFWDSSKVTIAAVHKYCLGVAFELALGCDLTIAETNTRLGAPEAKFGSGVIAMLLPWLTSPKLAKELLLTGNDHLTPERGFEMGIINRVCNDGDIEANALALAREVAQCDVISVCLIKKAINQSLDKQGLRSALKAALEIEVEIETTNTPESSEFNRILSQDGIKAALAWRTKLIDSL